MYENEFFDFKTIAFSAIILVVILLYRVIFPVDIEDKYGKF